MKKQYIKPEIAEYRIMVSNPLLNMSSTPDSTPATGPACGRDYDDWDED